jgi:hypothetical protein
MWKLGDTVIREGKSWRDSNGVTHPQTWARWTDDEKKAAGLTFVADPKTWDNRFYWGWNADETALIERNIADVNEVDDDGNPILDQDGNQVVTLGLKSVAIARTKETARTETYQKLIGTVRERQRREQRYQLPYQITERLSALRQALSKLP